MCTYVHDTKAYTHTHCEIRRAYSAHAKLLETGSSCEFTYPLYTIGVASYYMYTCTYVHTLMVEHSVHTHSPSSPAVGIRDVHDVHLAQLWYGNVHIASVDNAH